MFPAKCVQQVLVCENKRKLSSAHPYHTIMRIRTHIHTHLYFVCSRILFFVHFHCFSASCSFPSLLSSYVWIHIHPVEEDCYMSSYCFNYSRLFCLLIFLLFLFSLFLIFSLSGTLIDAKGLEKESAHCCFKTWVFFITVILSCMMFVHAQPSTNGFFPKTNILFFLPFQFSTFAKCHTNRSVLYELSNSIHFTLKHKKKCIIVFC